MIRANRSIQVSQQALNQARQAFIRKGYTQEDLASQVGIKTRQPVGRFLAGKPIERRVFMELCFQLDLDWQEIAGQPRGTIQAKQEKSQDNIDELVRLVRSHRQDKIQQQCGTLSLLDVGRPIELDDIYIRVNILEEIASQRWLEISDLLQGFNPDTDEFDRFGLSRVRQAQIIGLEAVAKYSKLMVLGKPGSGKTTFLKYVALSCNKGAFQADRIPIFISLKNYSEDVRDAANVKMGNSLSLEDYIRGELGDCAGSDAVGETLLQQGKTLILLDGLDEVKHEYGEEVLKQIRRFTDKYYKNQFAIACRIAAQPYQLPGFTEVEIADFTSEQIKSYAKKWFVAVARNSLEAGLAKANRFFKKLKRPENKQIRELAVTPILLNLTCLVFAEKEEFPSKRSKIYEEGLDILLVRWDESRGIQRDEVYRQLSVAHKIKLLSQVAAISFEQGDYFFEQSKIQQHIADYLCQLPDPETDPEVLHQNSKAVLKSIEAQHGLLVERAWGIYSFSHLTFQEYLTARKIVAKPNPLTLNNLVSHVTQKRWREVFLLTSEMLPKADDLLRLMKQQIDGILADEEKLQQFLGWVGQKSLSLGVNRKPEAVRAFYFSLACALDHYLTSALKIGPANSPFPTFSYFPLPVYLSLVNDLDPDLARHPDLAFDRYFAARNRNVNAPDPNLTQALRRINVLDRTLDCALRFNLALAFDRASELKRSLQQLKEQIPDQTQDLKSFLVWWVVHGQTWTEQLKALMIEHQDAGHNWQFSMQQKQLLGHYYEANCLLVNCLNNAYQVSPAVRSQIQGTLLLPTADFEQKCCRAVLTHK